MASKPTAGERNNTGKIRSWFRTTHNRLKARGFLTVKTRDRSDSSAIFPPDVCVRDTGTAKGRGAFARRSFKCNEVVEICPVVVIVESFQELPLELKRIIFDWGRLAGAPENNHGVVLGYGSIYNHDNPANMTYSALPAQLSIKYIATRDIFTGEELTINYNARGGESHDDHWFDRLGVKLIDKR